MDLVPKDQTTQIGLLLGSALLGILILKNFEKQLSSNISNGLVALVVVGTLYLAMEIHNKSQEGFYQNTSTGVMGIEAEATKQGLLLSETTAAVNVAPLVMDGVLSFTSVTVTVISCVSLFVPSLTVTVAV